MKILIWQDQAGITWLSYNDSNSLDTERHGLGDDSEVTVNMLGNLVGALAAAAAASR